MNMQSKLYKYLSIFLWMPIIIIITSELAFTGITFGIRTIDFIDICITGTFYIFIFGYTTHFLILNLKKPKLITTFIVLCLIYIAGHVLHFAGNTLNTLISEIYEIKIQNNLYNIIYFIDEDLSHLLLFFSGYSVISLFTYISLIQPKTKIDKTYIKHFFSGIGYASFQTLALISANKVILTPIFIVILVIPILYISNKKIHINNLLKITPITSFAGGLAIALIPLLCIYYVTFGSFVDPFTIFK